MTPPARESDGTAIGELLRQAPRLASLGVGTSRSEESMYGPITRALDELLPTRFVARVLQPGAASEGKPDISIVQEQSGAVVCHVEVKHSDTVHDVFEEDREGEGSQASRYRADGVPVWVTDSVNWWDISECDDLSRPICTFRDDDAVSDAASAGQLTSACWAVCKVRPRYNIDSAVSAISGTIASINEAQVGSLESGWEVVRTSLGVNLDADHLDTAGPGEIVAFTLLALAAGLDPLPADNFVDAASEEWSVSASRWRLEELPSTMRASLRLFREEDHISGGTLLGPANWVTIRSIAAWINQGVRKQDRWKYLSDLWDSYLHSTGRRRGLGSWQTHYAVAAYQSEQVDEVLQRHGYSGLKDPSVTVLDPCCGTGVYLEAVLDRAKDSGAVPQTFNAPTDGFPRLVGIDLSATAVAASHIRVAPTGAKPVLYMTDTLATGGEHAAGQLFQTSGSVGANAIVGAARNDHTEVCRWASRHKDREPVIAIIGNPPYQRAGLDVDDYSKVAWRTDVFDEWRQGSGGQGGGIFDPFVAFWAWAFALCAGAHPSLNGASSSTTTRMSGVVSFITNRSWLVTDTYQTMRSWVGHRAAEILVTDFGPGSRGNAASAWSAQPFAIETGTAIVTLVFDPSADPAKTVRYHKAAWEKETVKVLESSDVDIVSEQHRSSKFSIAKPFVPIERGLDYLSGVKPESGVITGEDARWVRATADRDFALRYSYRAFDNRWGPATPPAKAKRGEIPEAGQASAGAWWREKTLTGPHVSHVASGGWYLLCQSASAKPGPALHATRHVFDYHAFKGSEGGRHNVRVSALTPVPLDYQQWAKDFGLEAPQFWLYLLAAAHHDGYWTEGHDYADQLANKRVQPPLSENTSTIEELVELGSRLVEVWSLDGVEPAPHEKDSGAWVVEGEEELMDLRVHGRAVLSKWLEGRPDRTDWDDHLAGEYARTVAALAEVKAASHRVSGLLDAEE